MLYYPQRFSPNEQAVSLSPNPLYYHPLHWWQRESQVPDTPGRRAKLTRKQYFPQSPPTNPSIACVTKEVMHSNCNCRKTNHKSHRSNITNCRKRKLWKCRLHLHQLEEEMDRWHFKYIFNSIGSNMAAWETTVSTTKWPEQFNATETHGNNLKNQFMKTLEELKEEIRNSL